MSFAHASRLFQWAITVMQSLGWAWRWEEWWADNGDTWEPLLEVGQREEDMTDEELKIVKSTPESRRDDVKKCQLGAFGAALRNRDYDVEEGDDRIALDRALKAVLSTPSLVGPLKKNEIEFFADWLGRAYRAKSSLLGYREDKIPVATEGKEVFYEDGSPKFELGSRPLPGKQP
jgi:hypothetical protein